MLQANESALINPFQSFDSVSLPRVNLVRWAPPSLLCGLAPELGWRSAFCLVTDLTRLSRLHHQVRLRSTGCVGGGCQLLSTHHPDSWIIIWRSATRHRPGPHETTEEEFQFQIRNWFSAHSRAGCAASVGSHSVKSKLARNKNGIQIYVSDLCFRVRARRERGGHK